MEFSPTALLLNTPPGKIINKLTTHSAKGILIIVVVFIIIHTGAAFFPSLFQWADTRVHTLYFHIRQFIQGEQEVSPYLLLFTLDDGFEEKHNTPGKERKIIAEIIHNTRELETGTVLLDIIFRQRDNTPEGDKALIAALLSRGNILCPFNVNR